MDATGDRGSVYTLQPARPVHTDGEGRSAGGDDVAAIASHGTSPALSGERTSMMTTLLRHCLGVCAMAGLLATAIPAGGDDGRLAQAGGVGGGAGTGAGAGGMPSAPAAPSVPGRLGAPPTPGGVPQAPGIPQSSLPSPRTAATMPPATGTLPRVPGTMPGAAGTMPPAGNAVPGNAGTMPPTTGTMPVP